MSSSIRFIYLWFFEIKASSEKNYMGSRFGGLNYGIPTRSRTTLVCRRMSTYPNAHPNHKTWISGVQFPENRFEFDIISNDFRSSKIWACQILLSLTEVKTPKTPEFNLHIIWPEFLPESMPIECRTIFGSSDFKESPNSFSSKRNRSWQSSCIIVWKKFL